MTPKEINEAIHEVIELQTHQPDWWIKRQVRYLAKRLEELPVGQSIIVSNASAIALEEDDVKEVIGQFPEGTFKVFARFGGCEILKQKVKKES
jgi:hypothetical protein